MSTVRCLLLCCLAVPLLACNRPPPQQATGSTPPASAAATKPAATSADVQAGPALAQPSEHVASNKADPHCTDCQRADGSNAPTYYGKPDMPLDEKTLAEVTQTIDATSDILERGVELLEKHAKDPDKAAAAIDEYRKKSAGDIQKAFDKAKEIRARLKAAGYDQDIPAEVRPHFDARMTRIQERLEKMREVYRKHPDVLESFGALFPRTP